MAASWPKPSARRRLLSARTRRRWRSKPCARIPALDYILRGEPDLTLREVVDTTTGRTEFSPEIEHLYRSTDPEWSAKVAEMDLATGQFDMHHVKGLVWRWKGEIVRNADRPFIPNLDDLPLPMHHLLPLDKYRTPVLHGSYQFIVTSRGCSAGCIYCIKHVSYQHALRLRSPENIMAEIRMLARMGVQATSICMLTCSPSTATR